MVTLTIESIEIAMFTTFHLFSDELKIQYNATKPSGYVPWISIKHLR